MHNNSRFSALFLGVIILFCASCGSTTYRRDTYFDSLVLAQVRYLSKVHPSVTKIAILNGKADQSIFSPDSARWISELDIFRRLELFERASYREAYTVEDSLKDRTSNLLIRRFIAKPEVLSKMEVPIPELKFYYYRSRYNIRRIEATLRQGNALYHATRHLTMEFEESGTTPVLSAYGINGIEKMILSDTVKYSIQSRVESR